MSLSKENFFLYILIFILVLNNTSRIFAGACYHLINGPVSINGNAFFGCKNVSVEKVNECLKDLRYSEYDKIHLNKCPLSDVKLLKTKRPLKTLGIGAIVNNLEGIEIHNQLKVLSLYIDAGYRITSKEHFEKLTTLQDLFLHNIDTKLDFLGFYKDLKRLTFIPLDETLADEQLSNIKKLKKLEYLMIYFKNIEMIPALSKLPNIRQLETVRTVRREIKPKSVLVTSEGIPLDQNSFDILVSRSKFREMNLDAKKIANFNVLRNAKFLKKLKLINVIDFHLDVLPKSIKNIKIDISLNSGDKDAGARIKDSGILTKYNNIQCEYCRN